MRKDSNINQEEFRKICEYKVKVKKSHLFEKTDKYTELMSFVMV